MTVNARDPEGRTDGAVPEGAGGMKKLAGISLAALGVVFGDIGTSPLYAIRECFHGDYGIAASNANILGVLSLLFWALILIVSLKYLTFIMRADNEGEGGILALTALIIGQSIKKKKRSLGAGLNRSLRCFRSLGGGYDNPGHFSVECHGGAPDHCAGFCDMVIPATVVILAGLFLFQHNGTARLGALFGPIILLWFFCLGTLGIIQIIQYPQILEAVMPWYGINFLLNNQLHGFLVLGAVFLAVTGAEALYADMAISAAVPSG